MSWVAVAVGAGTVIAGVYGANQNRAAMSDANSANAAQNAADRALSAEELAQRKEQFGQSATFGAERAQSKRDYSSGLLNPYSQTGQQASGEQAALLGLGTPEEQSAAMGRFNESPGQKFMRERSEKALVRNAAKLGGLGGGNVRSALVEQGVGFAQQDYDNQFNRLGTLANRGMVAGQTMTGADLGVSKTALGLNSTNQAAKIAAAKAAAVKPVFAGGIAPNYNSNQYGQNIGGNVSAGNYNMSGGGMMDGMMDFSGSGIDINF